MDRHDTGPQRFDTDLPSVRLLARWIGEGRSLDLMLEGNHRLSGRLVWQDPGWLALEGQAGGELLLVARHGLQWITPLAVASAEPGRAQLDGRA